MSGSGILNKSKALRPAPALHGELGEVHDLRKDLEKALAPMANIVIEEFTNPAAASTTEVRGATATVTSAVETAVAVSFPYPRLISVTTAGGTPANAPATVTITGKDVDGRDMTETINVPQTATTAFGAKAFKSVSKYSFPAGDGTDATVAIGFGPGLGLSEAPMARAGLTAPVREIALGAAVTTGTLTGAATNPPYGLYTPSAAPNGSNDYAVFFEANPKY